MNEPSAKAKLYMKVVKVMEEVGQLEKDGEVKDKSGKVMYRYLSEELVTSELQKAFVKNKVVLIPKKVESELIYMESIQFDKEVKAPITKVTVTYQLCDAETGETEELQSIGYGSDSQDKGSNKAMTGAYKYVQRQTFSISTGEDGDEQGSAELDEKYVRRHAAGKPAPAQPTAPAATSNPSAAAAPGSPSNAPAADTSKFAHEAMVKMLNAKASAAGYKKEDREQLMQETGTLLGRTISSFTEVEKTEVTKLAQWLIEKAKAAQAS